MAGFQANSGRHFTGVIEDFAWHAALTSLASNPEHKAAYDLSNVHAHSSREKELTRWGEQWRWLTRMMGER